LATAWFLAAEAGAPRAAPAPPARPVLVRWFGACPKKCEWIEIQGVIDKETPAAFERLIASLGKSKPPVFFWSQGGDVAAAMALGGLIRAHGLDTSIAAARLAPQRAGPASSVMLGELVVSARAFCASACALAFAGGVRRYAPLETSLGLHEMVRPEQDVSQKVKVYETRDWTQDGHVVARATQLVREETVLKHVPRQQTPEGDYRIVADYLTKMGVDGQKAVALMRVASPQKMDWLTPEQILGTRLATERKRADALLDF
jgi:hypothetical protein